MANSTLPRPKRLWVAVLMNILVAGISVVATGYLLASSNPNIPESVRPGPLVAMFALGTSSLLIVSSVLALFRIRFSRWLMLAAALIFFGTLGFQSLSLLMSSGSSLPVGITPKLWANVIRNALEIAINVWAIFSSKSASFFAGNYIDKSFKADGSAVG